MLTNRQLLLHVMHALGDVPAVELNMQQIVNQAGQHLYSMRQWTFRERGEVAVSFVNGQTWVELPADFGEVSSYALDGRTSDFRFVQSQVIADLRSDATVTGTFRYWGAIIYPGQASQLDDFENPRIDLYPTPGDDGAILKLHYFANWPDMTDINARTPVGRHAESLMIELARTFALGYEEGENASMSARLADVEQGPIAQRAIRQDSMIQDEAESLNPTSGRRSDFTEYQTFASGSDWVT